jgi:hypothetical protein
MYRPEFVCGDSLTDFYGDKFWISDVELRYTSGFFLLFSELARSYKNRIGGLFGFSGCFPYIDFNLAAKYFPIGFYSPKGYEAKDDYIATTLDIKHHSRIANLGVNLTIDDKTDEDSVRYYFKLNFGKRVGILDAKFQLRWRYRKETKDLSGSKIFLRLRPHRIIFFDLRFEEKYVYSADYFEKGIFGAFEVGTEFKKFLIRIRYGLFDTDSYDSRIFAYEIDLPGVITNRMLYNEGNCGFIYASFRPIDVIKMGLKYTTVNRDTLSMKQFGCQIDIKL